MDGRSVLEVVVTPKNTENSVEDAIVFLNLFVFWHCAFSLNFR